MECFRFNCCKNPMFTGKCDSCVEGSGFELKHTVEELEKLISEGKLYIKYSNGVVGEHGVYIKPSKEYKVNKYAHVDYIEADFVYVESEYGQIILVLGQDDFELIFK